MRKSRYTEAQITSAIKDSENGVRAKDICDSLGISEATFYSWKKKYAGLDSEQGRKIRELEETVQQLSRELELLASDKEMLQRVMKQFFTTGDKRRAVDFLQETFAIGTRHSCRLLDISRSVYRYPCVYESH